MIIINPIIYFSIGGVVVFIIHALIGERFTRSINIKVISSHSV